MQHHHQHPSDQHVHFNDQVREISRSTGAPAEEAPVQEGSIDDIQAILGDEYPVVVKYAAGQGRYVLASRDIEAGELVMKAPPFSTAVEDHLKTHVCSQCYVFSPDTKLPIHCKRCCEVWYCSEACMQKASNEHSLFECPYYRRIRVIGDRMEFDSDGFTEVKIVIHILAKMVYLKKKEEGIEIVGDSKVVGHEVNHSVDEHTSVSASSTNPIVDSDNQKNDNISITTTIAAASTVSDSPVTNNNNGEEELNAVSKLSKIRGDSYWDIFRLVSNQEHVNDIARSYIKDLEGLIFKIMMRHIQTAFPAFEPQDIFDIICKQRCNRFGIWSRKDKCLGIALSPAASFFNHSCVPNCVHEQEGKDVIIRTLHAVPKGAELCISYISLQQETELRASELLMNYHFKCGCVRCKDTSGVYDKWMDNFYCVSNNCQTLLSPSKVDTSILRCTVCGFERKVDTSLALPGILP